MRLVLAIINRSKRSWTVIIAGIIGVIGILTVASFSSSLFSTPAEIEAEPSNTPNNSSLLNQMLERSVTTRVLENGTQVISFRNPRGFDENSLKDYIEKRSEQLAVLSAAQPNKEVYASVSFNRPIAYSEYLQIVSQYNLNVSYFEYDGGDYSGGGVAWPQNFENIGLGITYILGNGTALAFEELNQHKDVILSDINFFLEIEEERMQGNKAGSPNIPRNLYGESKSLGLLKTHS